MLRKLALASCLAACAAAAPAHADIARLSATYDLFLENTVFTITNTSAVSESVELTTSFASPTFVNLPTLAAGTSETYSFDRLQGGFATDPASLGTPDTTTYRLLVGLNNAPPTLSSADFSPISNLTGGDVDFLGNQCNGVPGGVCGTTIALSGLVASVPQPVPEPVSISLLLAGLGGLALIRRRA